MSLEIARAFMRSIKRGIVVRLATSSNWYDCETALMVVVEHGAAAGYAFTEEEYRTVVTEAVEASLATGEIERPSDCCLFFLHELVEGGEDYLVFSSGTKEVGDYLIYGDTYAHLLGGTARQCSLRLRFP